MFGDNLQLKFISDDTNEQIMLNHLLTSVKSEHKNIIFRCYWLEKKVMIKICCKLYFLLLLKNFQIYCLLFTKLFFFKMTDVTIQNRTVHGISRVILQPHFPIWPSCLLLVDWYYSYKPRWYQYWPLGKLQQALDRLGQVLVVLPRGGCNVVGGANLDGSYGQCQK